MADTKQKPFIVTNTQARGIQTCGLTLRPGIPTEIPPQYVEDLKKSPAWRARWIVEGEAKMPPPQIVPLDKLTPEQAQKLIAAEKDSNVLSAWLDTEKRPEVLAALSQRIKSL